MILFPVVYYKKSPYFEFSTCTACKINIMACKIMHSYYII